eukprot:scaffold39914_cov62-Phaeocystis_antarctica.AAC.5
MFGVEDETRSRVQKAQTDHHNFLKLLNGDLRSSRSGVLHPYCACTLDAHSVQHSEDALEKPRSPAPRHDGRFSEACMGHRGPPTAVPDSHPSGQHAHCRRQRRYKVGVGLARTRKRRERKVGSRGDDAHDGRLARPCRCGGSAASGVCGCQPQNHEALRRGRMLRHRGRGGCGRRPH